MTIVFVCTGNTCRSPMAAALFARLCEGKRADVAVTSAGLYADGAAASAHSVAAMAEWGLDIAGHCSRPVTKELCEKADLMVGMTPSHAMALHAQYGVPLVKLRVLGQGIPDPYGGTLDDYRAARGEIEAAVRELHEALFGALTVDPMTEADVPFLSSLERICFADPWSEQGFLEELDNPCAVFCVAHDAAGQVAGYVGMHHVADEGAITNVAVHPAYRRRGVARLLLTALRRYAAEHGVSRVMLEVRASNEAAIRLYESEGFTKDGVRPRFYTHPTEDAVLYSLEVKG